MTRTRRLHIHAVALATLAVILANMVQLAHQPDPVVINCPTIEACQ